MQYNPLVIYNVFLAACMVKMNIIQMKFKSIYMLNNDYIAVKCHQSRQY